MQKKQRILTLAINIALALLVIIVYPFANSNANIVQAAMMSSSPTASPTNMSPNDMTVLTILVAVAIVAIVLIAVVILYLVYSRKPKETPHVYTSRDTETSTAPSQTDSEMEAKPFEVFLCYKKSSGKDYADHLKLGLEEVGFHTFEDCKDIPQTVTTEEGWTRVRDQALWESKYFVLIMTQGFDLSSEVVKEIAMARKQPNKTFVFFRHRSMGRKIVINLGDELFDIGRLEQISFESKEELLRLAINILKKP